MALVNGGFLHYMDMKKFLKHGQLSWTCLIGNLAYQEIDEKMKKSMSTVKAREFPEFGELLLCVIANR